MCMKPNEINKTMKELAQLLRMKEELEAEIDSAKDKLKEHMKEADITELIGDEHKATLKSVTSERLDTKAFKAEMPDVAKRYLVSSTSVRFNFA